MSILEEWNSYGVCPYGWKRRAPFRKIPHIHKSVCPKCGRDKDDWELKVMRWVSTVIWYNPLTWGSGYWETRSN